jgi:NitT/TauT family transport system substrate-binding protein
VAEPFITNIQRTSGARAVLDTSEPGGPTAEFPVAGWGIMNTFAQRNPKTIAAFQRAIGRAQRLATTDRTTVVKTLPTYVRGIDANTASVVTLGTYPTSLNPIRLQRVADLMLRYGYLSKQVNVAPMMVAAPPSAK